MIRRTGCVFVLVAIVWAATYSASRADQPLPNVGFDIGWKGTHSFAKPIILSSATGITAAGTTQATATALPASLNDVTTVASGTGVIVSGIVGQRQEVWNSGANALLVYPPSGAAIGASSTNAAVSLAAGTHASFVCFSATICRQAP